MHFDFYSAIAGKAVITCDMQIRWPKVIGSALVL